MLQAVLLGVLQGLTEFLPVSSSAHLVAAERLLGVEADGVLLEVSLHVGTLLAILVVFARELWAVARDGVAGAWMWLRGNGDDIAQRAPLFPTALAVAVGTVPAACAGVVLEARIEGGFDSVPAAGALLMVTGLALLASRAARPGAVERVGVGRGLIVGVAQACALFPGVSRSGATIVTGLFCGLERRTAGRFAFVLAVPALAGAGLWELWQVLCGPPAAVQGAGLSMPALACGALAAALSGTACLLLLLRVVERGQLHWFAAYCLPVGAAMVALGLL